MDDPRLVEAVARRLLDQVGAGRALVPPSPLMEVLFDRFMREKGRKHRAREATEWCWARLCRFRFPDGRHLPEMHALELTPDFPGDYSEWAKTQPTKRKKPPAPATINRTLIVFRSVLNWSLRQRRIPYNPCGIIAMEEENNVRQTRIRSESEFDQLLTACHQVHRKLGALVVTYYDGGLRRMEGIRMRWDEIEVQPNGSAIVRLSGRRTKTGKPRWPRLPARTVRVILALPRVSEFVFANDWVYPGGKRSRHYGRPYYKRYVSKKFDEAVILSGLQAAEGEKITIHTLRHSFVYRARRRWKWPESLIMRQTGHLSRCAFERYGNNDDEELDEGIETAQRHIEADLDDLAIRERKGPQRAADAEKIEPVDKITTRRSG